MELKFNKKFLSLVGDKFSLDSIKFCEASSFVINEEIVVSDDCYYFKTYAIDGFSPSLIDRTGNEFFFNQLFIDDLIKKDLTPIERFWCGLSVAKELVHKLQDLYKEGFVVSLTYNYEHCYVRFYKIREGERMLRANLEEYKHDAVLIITI